MKDTTKPNEATNQADEADAGREHTPDRAPSAEEEGAAERGRALTEDPESVAAHYEEMMEVGADVKGEGEVK
ncbi:MAG TPA: hypothetical protein VGL48_06060 [Acidimicrobiales bacterium]|jgi:hypothetical protein